MCVYIYIYKHIIFFRGLHAVVELRHEARAVLVDDAREVLNHHTNLKHIIVIILCCNEL